MRRQRVVVHGAGSATVRQLVMRGEMAFPA